MWGGVSNSVCASMEGLRIHKVDGTPVDVDLSTAHSVADIRSLAAVALGVEQQPFVGIKLLNGACDVCNDTPLQGIDKDVGLCVVLVQGAPDWYPRETYMHNDQEVLQITGQRGGEYFAEFVNGSSEGVDIALYEMALRIWSWREVSVEGRVWLHPPEKPEESGGWTSFFTSQTARKTAIRGAGAAAGFFVGVTGHHEWTPNDGSDFSTAYRVAQVIGLVAYMTISIARAVRK